VVGFEGAQGSVTGLQTAAGSATGAPQLGGDVVGLSVNGGVAAGTAGLVGACSGTSASTGSVTGTVPTPPTPPAPTPAPTGGGRRYYVQPKPLQPTIAAGAVTGSSASRGRSRGRCDYNGASAGRSTTAGLCRGISRLSASPIRIHIDHEHRRRKAEDELLLLEMT
jgi:hypothetical protein